MARYRKRPIEIEAVQWDGTEVAAGALVAQIKAGGGDAHYDVVSTAAPSDGRWEHRLLIGTLEGWLIASPGDWIIRGIQGEFYPCKPDIFAETYEPVDRGPG